MLFIIQGVRLLIVMPRANASYIFISFLLCVKDHWVMYLRRYTSSWHNGRISHAFLKRKFLFKTCLRVKWQVYKRIFLPLCLFFCEYFKCVIGLDFVLTWFGDHVKPCLCLSLTQVGIFLGNLNNTKKNLKIKLKLWDHVSL